MPRANRHYIPGCVWHITHRCHKQQFLLKFEKDRIRWRYWLYEAKKRYGLCVLNYIVTSNHVHLLVVDTNRHVISKSLQLIAGRTAQEYNARKVRKGAFWEDRYHATGVEADDHLVKCLVYIDLNMVRAGVVKHPSEYKVSGFNEIQNPPERYTVIDRKALLKYFSFQDQNRFRQEHLHWVESELAAKGSKKNELWSEAVAVGSEKFVREVQEKLALQVKGRTIITRGGLCALKEPLATYSSLFNGEKKPLSLHNSYHLSLKDD